MKMKTNRIIVRALVLLGFGGAVGLTAGCSATRASKNRTTETTPVADSVVVVDDPPIMVMYGVAPVRFDPDKPIQRIDPERTE
jgi:hypothetical protein